MDTELLSPEPLDLDPTSLQPVLSPQALLAQLPRSAQAAQTVAGARRRIAAILRGQDPRLLVVVGPCSIHDEAQALRYARGLAGARARWGDALELVMRVYVDKPRTRLGWRGFLLDPDLDGRPNLNAGLVRARRLMAAINELGVPVATELLAPQLPPYLADLLSWGCLGARTVESQTHRVMASALPFPVGFKNGTGGSVGVAVDAVVAAQARQMCWTTAPDGTGALTLTPGNPHGHVVLRGGHAGPNADPQAVAQAAEQLRGAGLTPRLLVDCAHANSGGDPARQAAVGRAVLAHWHPASPVRGLMLESHLHPGRQPFPAPGECPAYGLSLTDPCLGWPDTEVLLAEAAATVRQHETLLSCPV
ncbi:3-deoxy-7-phosphoheptulonate synthase [Deinococcus aquaedulcis]|uniref:3-deoxy-7-phosphoheptulonate synthase n=1 Tax=Deinococcus aquaedulcis TaxID=2840455 RepID=UPI001F399996|nr:3-deoxy-7-phosphoheptulonate synthase [Deinococcus aquaedulcis]